MGVLTRLLPLEGGHNFRDLGGYETADGRRVKWGKIFRSGVMSDLTDADFTYLNRHGIRVVCDFRSTDERGSEPTVWRCQNQITYLTWDYENAAGVLRQALAGLVSAERVRRNMIAFYEQMAYDHAEKYRALFDHVAEGELPLVFNCSAGKDRTGGAAALLLIALGVPTETVVEDYQLTELVVDQQKVLARSRRLMSQNVWGFLQSLPDDVRWPLMRSDPEYIHTMLTTLAARHGSVLGFIENELGVDAAKLERIRDHLLE